MRFLLSFISLVLFIFSLSTVSATSLVGGDTDSYGCKASAGYSWSNRALKCIRPWESHVRVITVGPKKADCMGVAPMQCLQVRYGIHWQNFYNSIAGFDYTPGYTYRLLVLETKVSNPPADGSSYTYELIRILSKKPTAEMLAQNPLLGAWKLVAYNGKDVTGKYTATFEAERVSLRFCNSMSGDFKRTGNTFTSSGLVSTMMYCEGESMALEGNFNLDGAVYGIISTRSIPPQHILTITTKQGNIYTYKR